LDTFEKILLVAPVLLFSMVAHEYAHGYAALKQGDTTAQQPGRLTWNPIKHIDPFLTILMPLVLGYLSNWQFIFGGAKPVPVNPRNYRHYRRGDIIVSLAGIGANALIAIGCVAGIVVLGLIGRVFPAATTTLGILQLMLDTGIYFNLILIFFNLMPIPPLDGSHVVKHLLPPAWAIRYQRLGMYGMLILLALLTVGQPLFTRWMAPVFYLHDAASRAVQLFVFPSPWA
jgi:Zn-dependent protease